VLGFRFSEAGELRGVAGVAGFDGFDASASASAARSSHRGGTSRNLVYSDGEVPADALADADSRFATIRGVRIHYKDSFTFSAEDQSESVGDGGAESGFFPPDAAVVFVHGFGAGAFSWRKIAPSLATMLGVRVICLDRPGFGLSARPKRGEFSESDSPYDVLEQARIVIELCAFLGVERVLFVGHADGCLVAMRAATEAEEMTPLEDASLEKKSGSNKVRVAGLALLAADARLDAAVPAPVRLLLNTKLGEKMLRPLLRTEMGEVANRRAWFDRSKLNGETLRLYQLPLCIEGWDSALMEAARTRQKMTQRDISIALEALKDTPTLMVTGADDVVAPPTRAIAVAAELRRCALKILPRCGHLPHEESPRALLEALRPFVLETLQRGRGRASLLEEP
jgi:pimeloyl-ACP methyl ester carboxylesterase